MSWQLEYSLQFVKQSKKLDYPTLKRVSDYLDAVVLSGEPRSRGKALTGNYGGYWRYRIGDYRIIAEICDSKLVVIALEIGHRSEIYRKSK
ncbi:MAG: type II toxin-antitoxin system RelE/ParE family toxin [Coriobacteriales bacterium]|jgi:mRNA interferase RelE/StbE|nr:type II toxin-antitoxin system RelE/ParE family toxin [Coriobacteriales bacterium]